MFYPRPRGPLHCCGGHEYSVCTELHGVVRTTKVAMEENDGAVTVGSRRISRQEQRQASQNSDAKHMFKMNTHKI